MAIATRLRRLTGRPARDPEGRMTLVEHLAELRTRLFVSLVAVAAGGLVGFLLYDRILDFLLQPYCDLPGRDGPCSLFVTDPLEPFLVRLKVAAWSGLFFASPVVLWQLWRFVTPGLRPNEKRYAVPFVAASVVLFSVGGLVAMATFPRALDFLVSVGGENLSTIFSPTRYLRLIILMIVGFGLAFEFPVLLVFLQLAGALSSSQLRGWRRQAVVCIFAGAALITPSQDPWSLMAMAGPMYLFYEGAILVGRLMKR